MTFRSLCLCLVLTGATTAFGQQQASIQVNGGRIVGQFIPDGQPSGPTIDPGFQQPVIVQPQQQQHSHQHGAGCTCGQCQRTVVGRTTQIFAKTHMTKVTTEHSVITHPVQSFNESPAPCPTQQRVPCPPPCQTQQRHLHQPQNLCGHQQGMHGNTRGIASPWDTNFPGYQGGGRQQMRSALGGGNLLTVNAGFGVLGYGPQLNASVGRNPPMQALPSWR